MKLEDFQQFVAAALAANSVFSAAGLRVWDNKVPANGSGIIIDDGSDERLPGVEAALVTKGIAMIVGIPQAGSALDFADGKAAMEVSLPLTIEENVEVNRSNSGTGILPVIAMAEAIRQVSQTATGHRAQRNVSPKSFVAGGFKEGLWRCVIVFRATIYFA